MSSTLAGLMWSSQGRTSRKTHVFLAEGDEDTANAIICNDPRAEYFGWDGDLPTETPAELLERIEKSDADGIICRSCVKALKKVIGG